MIYYYTKLKRNLWSISDDIIDDRFIFSITIVVLLPKIFNEKNDVLYLESILSRNVEKCMLKVGQKSFLSYLGKNDQLASMMRLVIASVRYPSHL